MLTPAKLSAILEINMNAYNTSVVILVFMVYCTVHHGHQIQSEGDALCCQLPLPKGCLCNDWT